MSPARGSGGECQALVPKGPGQERGEFCCPWHHTHRHGLLNASGGEKTMDPKMQQPYSLPGSAFYSLAVLVLSCGGAGFTWSQTSTTLSDASATPSQASANQGSAPAVPSGSRHQQVDPASSLSGGGGAEGRRAGGAQPPSPGGRVLPGVGHFLPQFWGPLSALPASAWVNTPAHTIPTKVIISASIIPP